MLKLIVQRLFRLFDLNVAKSPAPGLNMLGWQVKLGKTPQSTTDLSLEELLVLLEREKNDVKILDVGVGDGRLYHKIKAFCGKQLLYEGLDFGNSVDFKNLHVPFVVHNQLLLDFIDNVDKEDAYDFVVASHFIEHQNNISGSLKALWKLTRTGGYLVIEFPLPHRKLFGGHVTLQTPALLAYNFAKVGADVKRSKGYIQGSYAILVIQKTHPLDEIDNMIWDTGEVTQLQSLLPHMIVEDCDMYKIWNNL